MKSVMMPTNTPDEALTLLKSLYRFKHNLYPNGMNFENICAKSMPAFFIFQATTSLSIYSRQNMLTANDTNFLLPCVFSLVGVFSHKAEF